MQQCYFFHLSTSHQNIPMRCAHSAWIDQWLIQTSPAQCFPQQPLEGRGKMKTGHKHIFSVGPALHARSRKPPNSDTNDGVESHTARRPSASQSEAWWLRRWKTFVPSWWWCPDQPFRSALRPAGGYLLMRLQPLTWSCAHWFLLGTRPNKILLVGNQRPVEKTTVLPCMQRWAGSILIKPY